MYRVSYNTFSYFVWLLRPYTLNYKSPEASRSWEGSSGYGAEVIGY
jgi:hypothetical protein